MRARDLFFLRKSQANNKARRARTSGNKKLSVPRRAQRAVEAAEAVHVLPVLGLLLLAHRAGVVAGDALVLCGAEAAKAHHGLHGGHVLVVVAALLPDDGHCRCCCDGGGLFALAGGSRFGVLVHAMIGVAGRWAAASRGGAAAAVTASCRRGFVQYGLTVVS